MVKFALVLIGLALIIITTLWGGTILPEVMFSNFFSLRTLILVIGILLLLWGVFSKKRMHI